MGRLIDCDKLCGDLLDRWSIADKEKDNTIRLLMADVVTPIVASQPTVDAAPVVHGHWIPCHPLGDDTPEGYMCSVCRIGGWEKTNFCPNCAARMDEKDTCDKSEGR